MTIDLKVCTGEVDEAVTIIRDVAKWCEDNKKDMWNLEDLTKEKLTKGLSTFNFCVGKQKGKGVAAMILQWQDTLFWPEIGENESGFLHKLCVLNEFRGLGISKMMVEFAKSECRSRGIRFLRLDTGLYKHKLCKHYEGMGFVKVGEKRIGLRDYALYEMAVDQEEQGTRG